MADAPLQVLTRPFAIEPVTGIMLPDGIFDNAIYKLRIACHYTNQSSSALTNVELYLESVGDPGIIPTAQTFFFASIPAGASVLVQWNADFKAATPGKPLVSFVAKADGFTSRRSIQQIFVSQTRFDPITNSYTCSVEEGQLVVSNIEGITQKPTWRQSNSKDRGCDCGTPGGPVVPTGMTLVWKANPTYSGVHGDLPFSDPWWKILALIVFIIAAIVAAVEAAQANGTASGGVSGTVNESDPSVHCCTPSAGNDDVPEGVAGAASAVAAASLAVALSDVADPFWRGQAATPPAAGEMTTGERVVAKWSLPNAPNAGKPFTADVQWTYTRQTTGATYTHSVSETQTNVHLSDGVEIDTPPTVAAFGTLWVRAKFQKTGGAYFRGNELYSFCLFRSPGGLYFVEPLGDDGLGLDAAPNDAVYTGSLSLEQAYRVLLKQQQDVYGVWRVYVFAQDVNLTAPGTPPEIAAQHIGGFFVSSAISITFDPSLPCPLKSVATITVV